MSTTHSIPTPGTRASSPSSRTRLLGWITAVGLIVVVATAVAIALWPASEADKARADGEHLGEAVGKLYNAQSAADVDVALADIHTAVADTRNHAGDAVVSQVNDQADALARAVDGFVGTNGGTDGFEADLYQAELNTAIDDLTTQADDFRATGPEVQQAYWDGFEEGLPGD